MLQIKYFFSHASKISTVGTHYYARDNLKSRDNRFVTLRGKLRFETQEHIEGLLFDSSSIPDGPCIVSCRVLGSFLVLDSGLNL